MQITVIAGHRHHHRTINLGTVARKLSAQLVVSSCAWCMGPFLTTAPHQLFCGVNCRKASFRARSRKGKCTKRPALSVLSARTKLSAGTHQ